MFTLVHVKTEDDREALIVLPAYMNSAGMKGIDNAITEVLGVAIREIRFGAAWLPFDETIRRVRPFWLSTSGEVYP